MTRKEFDNLKIGDTIFCITTDQDFGELEVLNTSDSTYIILWCLLRPALPYVRPILIQGDILSKLFVNEIEYINFKKQELEKDIKKKKERTKRIKKKQINDMARTT